jgi:predicted membrane-bound mannosyltransferase
MKAMPSNIPWRLIGTLVAILVLIAAVGLTVRSCDKRHSQAAQSRVEASQGAAKSESAADAVNTVSSAGERESASETLSRTNERDIRNAQGANVAVNSDVDLAGRRALCLRSVYRSDPKCRMFQPGAK